MFNIYQYSSILVTPTHVCYADQSRSFFFVDMPFRQKTDFYHFFVFFVNIWSILVNIRTYLPTFSIIVPSMTEGRLEEGLKCRSMPMG